MKLLNLKIISFWFIIGLSYCLPLSILANSDCKEAFPTAEEFRQVVFEQKEIKTRQEYIQQRKEDPELQRFPFIPEKIYKDFRWPAGRTKKGRYTVFPPFEEFWQVVIEQKGIRTEAEYKRRRKIDPELLRFPSIPEKIYKDKGFVWPEKKIHVWDDKTLPPLEEFLKVIEQKGIKTQREYIRQRRIDPELRRRFPFYPEHRYESFMWSNLTNLKKLEEAHQRLLDLKESRRLLDLMESQGLLELQNNR